MSHSITTRAILPNALLSTAGPAFAVVGAFKTSAAGAKWPLFLFSVIALAYIWVTFGQAYQLDNSGLSSTHMEKWRTYNQATMPLVAVSVVGFWLAVRARGYGQIRSIMDLWPIALSAAGAFGALGLTIAGWFNVKSNNTQKNFTILNIVMVAVLCGLVAVYGYLCYSSIPGEEKLLA